MKKNKVSLNILNKMKEQIIDNSTEITIEYKSKINYTEYELSTDEIDKIMVFEEKVVTSSNQLKKNLIDLAEGLSQAQKLFANNKTGTFQKWFEELGLKKTFVYTLLNRQELYTEFKDEKVFQIPERVLPELKKLKKEIPSQDIIKIINSEKPMEEVKNISFGCRTNKILPNSKDEIEECEIVEDEKISRIKEIEMKIAQKYKEIQKLEIELNNLKS